MKSLKFYDKIINLNFDTLKKFQLKDIEKVEINYEDLKKELMKYFIDIKSDPSFDDLTNMLAITQQYRSRIVAILIEAISNAELFKGIYQKIFDHEIVNVQAPNSEKRIGIINTQFFLFKNAADKAKNFERIVKLVLDNINATYESLSRQITALSEENKMKGII